MTEERAILQLRYRIDTATSLCGKGADGKAYEDMEMAIRALEEIQQYREIGTVDECREARERQKKKRGIPYNSGKNHKLVECPNCHKDMDLYYEYCHHCGQAVDWR